jgi:hypothetical protein
LAPHKKFLPWQATSILNSLQDRKTKIEMAALICQHLFNRTPLDVVTGSFDNKYDILAVTRQYEIQTSRNDLSVSLSYPGIYSKDAWLKKRLPIEGEDVRALIQDILEEDSEEKKKAAAMQSLELFLFRPEQLHQVTDCLLSSPDRKQLEQYALFVKGVVFPPEFSESVELSST